ncbi:MAG TPA: adenylate/guanylate cyclase domain-containing protein, partial [Blastocatellia bacterium]|nr:adenylate/guanylate cyclase domain-containing protein [Blastocatellia bacterium]
EIKGKGRRQLQPPDKINIGQTTLYVQQYAGFNPPPPTLPAGPRDEYDVLPFDILAESLKTKAEFLDANAPALDPHKSVPGINARRLTLFYELALRFGEETHLDSLLQLIVEQVMQTISGAKRGALLLKDRHLGRLLLKAAMPVGFQAVSQTIAQQSMQQRKAFIWPPPAPPSDVHEVVTKPLLDTIIHHNLKSTMYAPLTWKNEVLGVVCVDNPETPGAFDSDDLRLLQAVAHHAAMAVAHHYAQDDLRRHVEFTSLLFSSRFPPRVREKLMREAAVGALPIGTRRSPVTILIADIRGFTNLTARLGPGRTSDLLNEYFPALINAVFAHEGTIERFMGDSIFAVFGSPEPDLNQHENAVRAALAMQEAVEAISEMRRRRGAETCGIGIGIDCGEVLHGFIGNAERMEFAVIGDAANHASRYCAGAGGGQIIISPAMAQSVWNMVNLEKVSVQTKHEGIFAAYQVTGCKRA